MTLINQKDVERFVRDHVRTRIEQSGWWIQSVFPVDGGPTVSFSYTVGLTEVGRSELIVTGLPGHVTEPLIEAVAHQHRRIPYQPGDHIYVPLEGAPPESKGGDLLLADAVAIEPYIPGLAFRLYGAQRVRLLQIVWDDDEGRHPDDPGWDTRLVQPLLARVPRGKYTPDR